MKFIKEILYKKPVYHNIKWNYLNNYKAQLVSLTPVKEESLNLSYINMVFWQITLSNNICIILHLAKHHIGMVPSAT